MAEQLFTPMPQRRMIPQLPADIPIMPEEIGAAKTVRLPVGLMLFLVLLVLALLLRWWVSYSDYDKNQIDSVMTRAMAAHVAKGALLPVTLRDGARVLQIVRADVKYQGLIADDVRLRQSARPENRSPRPQGYRGAHLHRGAEIPDSLIRAQRTGTRRFARRRKVYVHSARLGRLEHGPRTLALHASSARTASPLDGHFLLLGENPDAGGYLHVRAPLQHILSIAPTRSGKGVSLIIPNLLTYLGLGSRHRSQRRKRLDHGRRAAERSARKRYIVDPWNEVNTMYGSKAGAGMEERSIASFNPLSILKPGADDFVESLAYLADALIITQSTKDPFWDDSARELCAGLMAYVVENPAFAPGASLGLVRKLLMRPNEELQRTIKTAIGLGSGSVAALKLGQFENPEKTTSIASVIQAARTQTAFLDSLTQQYELRFQLRRVVPRKRLHLSGAADGQVANARAVAPPYGLDRNPRGHEQRFAKPARTSGALHA